ncbi:TetR/AcrR family transcriptional regulator [Pseudonocardia sp. C8]|uniref:TetR/AcrR family transcriptional regulator n=1 Tax=Pseudonocardia sp. C8 TaxID=2762759 RepID=UPI001643440B|nr:TetR/AcrR family transcriptional regulator [Pseudonocardia sp. C8]
MSGPSARPGRATPRRTDADGAGTGTAAGAGPSDTRTKIVLAAERLFAERGIAAVPLRDIVTAAGQRNASAIQYHFGPRPDLVTAVFQYRMGQINERRLEHLAQVYASGRAADPRTLVEALVRPLVEAVGEPGCHYARFLAQLSASPNYRVSDSWQIASSLRAVREGLQRALDHLPAEVYAERWRMVTHLFIHTIADHEKDDSHPPRTEWATRLIDACVAVLTAPLEQPPPPRAPRTGDGEPRPEPVG